MPFGMRSTSDAPEAPAPGAKRRRCVFGMPFTGSLIALIALTTLLGCEKDADPIHVMKAEPFEQSVSATGRLIPSRELQIQPQVAARVVHLPFEDGDHVSKGEVVARLDSTDIEMRIRETRSKLALARARLRTLEELSLPAAREQLRQLRIDRERQERTLQRQETLHSNGSLSLDIVEETRAALALLKSQIESAKLSVRSLETGGAEAAEAAAAVAQSRTALSNLEQEMQRYVIIAPFDGIVMENLIEAEEMTQSGSTIMLFASQEGSHAEIELDERVIALIEPGQDATIRPEAFPSRSFSARISKVAPRARAATGTVRVRLELTEEPDLPLRDLTIRTMIRVRALDNALLLPLALRWSDEPSLVLVVADGRVVEREVTAELVDVENLLVIEGLAPGDTVLEPDAGFAPGDTYRLPRKASDGDES